MISRLTLDPTPLKPPGCRRVHEAGARQREIGAALDGHTVARRHEELLGAATRRSELRGKKVTSLENICIYLVGRIFSKRRCLNVINNGIDVINSD